MKYRCSKAEIVRRYRINKDIGVRFTDKNGKEKVRLLWKGSLAKDSYPLGKEADIIHKPKNILKKPTLAIRMSAGICEWCGKHTTELEVHQVRSLKELDDKEAWAIHMKRINRKTLVVCKDCHNLMHSSNG